MLNILKKLSTLPKGKHITKKISNLQKNDKKFHFISNVLSSKIESSSIPYQNLVCKVFFHIKINDFNISFYQHGCDTITIYNSADNSHESPKILKDDNLEFYLLICPDKSFMLLIKFHSYIIFLDSSCESENIQSFNISCLISFFEQDIDSFFTFSDWHFKDKKIYTQLIPERTGFSLIRNQIPLFDYLIENLKESTYV